MENSAKQEIYQISRITIKNSKTEYRGRTYTKNEVVIEPGWLSYAVEFHEPEFYKLVKTVTRDDDSKMFYSLPVGQCNEQTPVEESKYEEKRKIALTVPGGYISKKEPRKISEKKTMCLYIVPGGYIPKK